MVKNVAVNVNVVAVDVNVYTYLNKKFHVNGDYTTNLASYMHKLVL